LTPFLQLSLALAILIAAAKIGGYISYRLGQPSVLGELLVGILLGPSLIDILHQAYFINEYKHLSEVIFELAEIGVLLLMFIAGLELHLSDLAKSGKVAALAGTLGVIFPVLMGAGLGLGFSMGIIEAIFLGLILSATSVSISAQTLMELKVLRSRVGISLLGAAVFDDILVVLGLSIFTALYHPSAETSGLVSVLTVILRMVLFLVFGVGLGLLIIPRLSRKIGEMPVTQGLIAFTVIVILLYGWAAEMLGNMAAITGAFLAGLIFAQSPVKDRVQTKISIIAYGLFVPLFFINVGLNADIHLITKDAFWLFFAMTVVAVIAKILGSGLGAYWGGFTQLQATQLGVGMISRGEVGLIVATVGIEQGIINPSVYAAVVGMIIVTTLITPPLLRSTFRAPKKKQPETEPTGDKS
jgi:Kef-type K+ transport system membrane component KefB